MVEDSLCMNTGALVSDEVQLIREFQPVPLVHAEKGKTLQIVSNLVRNAKRACAEARQQDQREAVILLRVEPGATGLVRLIVKDNGMGIPAENLRRIFAPSFARGTNSTFGLHACANAAREMKGSLTALSDGVGKGATFILELPGVA